MYSVDMSFLCYVNTCVLASVNCNFLRMIIINYAYPFRLGICSRIKFIFLVVHIVADLNSIRAMTLCLLISFFPVVNVEVVIILGTFYHSVLFETGSNYSFSCLVLLIRSAVRGIMTEDNFYRTF